MRNDPGTRPHVVIVGGGFGGLYAARALARMPVRITLVDRRNHHLFQPLLYQVATAALSPADIASPIRGILRRQQNVTVLLGEVTSVDAANRRLALADGELTYDYLVLAAGAAHSYFGHDDWGRAAPGLKTLEDALEIRRRILLAFELAERERDPGTRAALLTFVVVGGGPTGVELAGAIAEISRHALAKDFRAIDPTCARVVLVEAGPRIVPSYPEKLSIEGVRELRALGVEVRTNTQVTSITPEAVHFGEERLPARTVLWAAGVAASPLALSLGVPLDRAGRVIVEPDLTIPGHRELFVIGDMAAFTHQTGKPLPGVCPVAIQEARAVAENIEQALRGRAYGPFHYVDKGSMATIGRAAGLCWIGRLQFGGFLGWLAWLFIHIFFLIGFRNRLIVMIEWAWAYMTYQRGARLITGDVRKGDV
ncbi:MAG: NAD(P)/FAD-dependent oxidoreductase [Acidobacteria bacterium]|nr:NAD(P)/FAD-dependent oxidoreductase [Acidobacteriota bacterium]